MLKVVSFSRVSKYFGFGKLQANAIFVHKIYCIALQIFEPAYANTFGPQISRVCKFHLNLDERTLKQNSVGRINFVDDHLKR